MVSVDVKHHVYLLRKRCVFKFKMTKTRTLDPSVEKIVFNQHFSDWHVEQFHTFRHCITHSVEIKANKGAELTALDRSHLCNNGQRQQRNFCTTWAQHLTLLGMNHSFLLDRALYDLENFPAGEKQKQKQTALCLRGEASGTSSGTVTVIGRELPAHPECPASC